MFDIGVALKNCSILDVGSRQDLAKYRNCEEADVVKVRIGSMVPLYSTGLNAAVTLGLAFVGKNRKFRWERSKRPGGKRSFTEYEATTDTSMSFAPRIRMPRARTDGHRTNPSLDAPGSAWQDRRDLRACRCDPRPDAPSRRREQRSRCFLLASQMPLNRRRARQRKHAPSII